MGATLPAQEAQAVLVERCEHGNTGAVYRLWTPSGSDIARLEARLGPVLQQALDRRLRGESRLNPGDYYRQYIGVVRPGGRRTVYVNGFHRSFARMYATSRAPGEAPDSLRWRTSAIEMCDGGAMFFRTEFDPKTSQFAQIRFNGVA